MENSAETPKTTVPTLTTLSASMTFENLPDDKKGEVFLHWIGTQSEETKLHFLNAVKNLVTGGITEDPNFYHYVIIESNLTTYFADQVYIDILNARLDDLVGEDRIIVAYVDNGKQVFAAPGINVVELIAAIEVKDPKFTRGICFKLQGDNLDDDEHLPMYLDCLQEVIDGMSETFHHVLGYGVVFAELTSVFKDMGDSNNRISYDFEITLLNGQKQKIAHFAPKS